MKASSIEAPWVSTTLEESGGMRRRSRAWTRSESTDSSGFPGAITCAPGTPKSSWVGATPQIFIEAKGVA